MKALDECFLMGMFTLLLSKVHVLVFLGCKFYVQFEQRNKAVKG